MKKEFKVIFSVLIALIMLVGCNNSDKENIEDNNVLIYTSINTNRIGELQEMLNEKFPNYNIIVEYQSTSKQTAQLLAEGTDTSVDITHDLAYANIQKLSDNGYLANIENVVDYSILVDDLVPSSKDYYIECLTGGCFMINNKVLSEKGLEKPTSYEDLLKPEYKGLISMPDPKSSGTGYMFVKSLINSWGDDEKVMNYFHELSKNVLSFTSSGNGPINSLEIEEAAIGLGMTANVVQAINDGYTDLEIIFPKEGSPYTAYGQGIIKGKENKKAVVDVFKFLTNDYVIYTINHYAPEKTLKDVDTTINNFPLDIKYSDMNGDSPEEKDRILSLWDNMVIE